MNNTLFTTGGSNSDIIIAAAAGSIDQNISVVGYFSAIIRTHDGIYAVAGNIASVINRCAFPISHEQGIVGVIVRVFVTDININSGIFIQNQRTAVGYLRQYDTTTCYGGGIHSRLTAQHNFAVAINLNARDGYKIITRGSAVVGDVNTTSNICAVTVASHVQANSVQILPIARGQVVNVNVKFAVKSNSIIVAADADAGQWRITGNF